MAAIAKTIEEQEMQADAKAAAIEASAKKEAKAGKGGDAQRKQLSGLPTPSRGSRSPGSYGYQGCNGNSGQERAARGQSSALEDVMRRRGVDEAWTTLEEMQTQGITTDKYTVSRMLMKTVGDGRSAKPNAQRIYRGISLVEKFIESQPKDVDEVLFNALLDTCCRLRDLTRLEATVKRMKDLNVQPSPVTLGILVKTYGQAGDLPKVLQVWSDMEHQRGQANAVTYGCMIDACVKCGNLAKAVEIFMGMRETGKHKNTILYTTLIKGYGLDKDLPNAMHLFREMATEGVPYNTITYNSILDACVKCNDLPTAEGLLREMMSPSSTNEPDLITFSTLLKGYCYMGDLDKALQVVEAIKARGLRCDELVYNTLMDGCVKANDMATGLGLFEEMVSLGLRPSAITHSILARLYQRAGYEEDANEAVAQLYQHHGVERPVAGEGRRGGTFDNRGNNYNRGVKGAGRSARSTPGHSPTASPMGCMAALRRHSSMSSDGGWSNMGDTMTPLATSPMQGAQPYLPIEAFRNSPIPPMPGCGSRGSGDLCATSSFGMAPGSATWSPMNSPMVQGGSPFWPQQGMECFSVPASPHTMGQQMQPGFFPQQHPQMFQQGLGGIPPFPFACGPMPQGVPQMPLGVAAGTMMHQGGIPNGMQPTGPGSVVAMDGNMQLFAVPMMMNGTGHAGMTGMTAHMPQMQPGQQPQQHQAFFAPFMGQTGPSHF
mmetsp:Transcript_140564/g.449296  ORF Transcript_140564/g.449296 Transcript_140564/m.449296 type:complete len:716 (+) Transcript_140564:108-2255(+)